MREKTRVIYLLFTRSETYPSRAIHFFTNGEFTHVSIGLEGPAGVFYSFARKYPQYPLPGGLVLEQSERGFFSLHPDVPCCLRTLTVSEDTYRFLRRRLGSMYRERDCYHYNLLGAITSKFGLPLARQRHKFCSEFVAEMLRESGAARLDKAPALTKPMDIYSLSGLNTLYRGCVGSMGA